MGDGETNLPILLQEASQALYQPCHCKTSRKLSGVANPDCANMLFKQTLSFSPRVSMIFRVCVGSSLTVDISVDGVLIVGR